MYEEFFICQFNKKEELFFNLIYLIQFYILKKYKKQNKILIMNQKIIPCLFLFANKTKETF